MKTRPSHTLFVRYTVEVAVELFQLQVDALNEAKLLKGLERLHALLTKANAHQHTVGTIKQ